MTLDPRMLGGDEAREARAAARRGARAVSGALVAVLAAVCGVVLMVLFTALDYVFDQDPHRLVKILAGVAVVGAVIAIPRFGMLVLPVATPFLSWMPVLPVPALNPLNVLVFGVFGSYALQRVLAREPVFRAGALGPPLGVFLLLAGLSVLRGIALPTGYVYDAHAAGINLFRSAMTFSVYFVALAMMRDENDRRRMGWSIVIGLALEAWVTIVGGRTGSGGRAEGSFGQPNELGTFLAMFTAFSLAMVPAVRRRTLRAVLLGAVVLGVIATLMTVSRGALLAITVALLYVTLRSSKLLAALLLLAALSSPAWIPDYVVQRLNSTEIEVEGTDEAVLEGSAQARLDTWRALWKVIGEHPLDGVGFVGLQDVLPDTGEALGLEVKDSSHNTYLRMLAEMGILGLLVFLWTLVAGWRIAWRASQVRGAPLDRAFGIGMGGAVLALAVSCAFGDRFFAILTTGNFFVGLAIADHAVRVPRAEGA